MIIINFDNWPSLMENSVFLYFKLYDLGGGVTSTARTAACTHVTGMCGPHTQCRRWGQKQNQTPISRPSIPKTLSLFSLSYHVFLTSNFLEIRKFLEIFVLSRYSTIAPRTEMKRHCYRCSLLHLQHCYHDH